MLLRTHSNKSGIERLALFLLVDEDMPDDNDLEGAVGGEIDHHTSQEQTDMESDSKGTCNLSFNTIHSTSLSLQYVVKYQVTRVKGMIINLWVHGVIVYMYKFSASCLGKLLDKCCKVFAVFFIKFLLTIL